MITLEQSNAIIKHRAAAASYDDIAKITGISKPTVIKVCKEREADILEARKIAWEHTKIDVVDFVSERRELYENLLKNACDIIVKRDISTMSNKEIFSLMRTLEQNLAAVAISNKDNSKSNKNPYSELTDEQLEMIIMEERASWAYQHPDKYPLNVNSAIYPESLR